MKRSLGNRAFAMTFVFVGCAAMFCSDALAQPGGRGGFGRMFDNPLTLLRNQKVVDELELVDDQVQQLRELEDEQRQAFRDAFSGFRERNEDVDREEMMQRMQEKMKEVMSDMESRLDEILLPHQTDRLKQLVIQQQIQRGGLENALGDDKLAEALGLSSEQREEMKKKAEEVRKQLAEKIEKLRQEAEQDILSVLNSSQREKLQELRGEKLDMSGGFDFRRQRGGDRGDRGRDRRDRNRDDF